MMNSSNAAVVLTISSCRTAIWKTNRPGRAVRCERVSERQEVEHVAACSSAGLFQASYRLDAGADLPRRCSGLVPERSGGRLRVAAAADLLRRTRSRGAAL